MITCPGGSPPGTTVNLGPETVSYRLSWADPGAGEPPGRRRGGGGGNGPISHGPDGPPDPRRRPGHHFLSKTGRASTFTLNNTNGRSRSSFPAWNRGWR